MYSKKYYYICKFQKNTVKKIENQLDVNVVEESNNVNEPSLGDISTTTVNKKVIDIDPEVLVLSVLMLVNLTLLLNNYMVVFLLLFQLL